MANTKIHAGVISFDIGEEIQVPMMYPQLNLNSWSIGGIPNRGTTAPYDSINTQFDGIASLDADAESMLPKMISFQPIKFAYFEWKADKIAAKATFVDPLFTSYSFLNEESLSFSIIYNEGEWSFQQD